MNTRSTAADGRGSGPGDVLSARAQGRAVLERQLLLSRQAMPAVDAIGHLVGMQAQAPLAPYVGLWTRLTDFRTDELAGLLTARQVVRIVLMRGTIHLVTAGDCLPLRTWLRPVLDRGLKATFGPRLAKLDTEAVAAAGRALVEENPLTPKEVGALLHERWPDFSPADLALAVRILVPLVQVPPRGIWGTGGQATHTSAEVWLGRSATADPSPDAMVLRYLAAFGPASAKDVQTWSGLTRLGEVTERLRPDLRTFRDEDGNELFDLPDAPRPDPDTPAPVRFLPEYDNVLRSHANRSHVVTDEHRRRLWKPNDGPTPTFLVDGLVRGTWKITRQRGTATLTIEPFKPLSKKDTAAVTKEGGRLLTFAAGADTQDIQLVPADR